MKLIVGLGNPGKQYEATWHNLGFMAVDQLQKNNTLPAFKAAAKFFSITTDGQLAEKKIVVAKPQTFMNDSGKAVAALAKFYKIKPKDILVIHDEVDLPLGTIRISQNASAAGHNGIKSIIEHLGSKEFVRVRLGMKPILESKTPIKKYVLQKINKQSKVAIVKVLDQAEQAIAVIMTDGLAEAMNQFN